MVTIQREGYVFSVDVEKTKAYYNTHSLCNCGCCRNYFLQIKERLPKLDAFLKEFGVDIARPDEIASAEMDGYIDYLCVDYTVCGKVEKMGKYEIDISDNLFVRIVITDGFASPNEQTGIYFTISVMQINLPWALNEPFPTPQKGRAAKKEK